MPGLIEFFQCSLSCMVSTIEALLQNPADFLNIFMSGLQCLQDCTELLYAPA